MRKSEGQALGEYSIGLALVAIALIGALIAMGGNITGMFTSIASGLQSQDAGEAKTSMGSTPQEIGESFIDLILKYRNEHGRWPRSWEPYNYSDLGLDPDKWSQPMDGVKYVPAGDRFGITNVRGDDYQVYIKAKNGRRLHVYDGYGVWYDFNSGQWYYHSRKRNIPVDINTLKVVKKKHHHSKPPKPPVRIHPPEPPEPLPPAHIHPPEPLPPERSGGRSGGSPGPGLHIKPPIRIQ